MRQESNLQGREARLGSGQVPSASRIAHPERMAEVSRPSPCGPTRVRAGGCASAASPSMSGERRTRIPAVARPAAFQAVPTPWPVHSPRLLGVRDTPNTPRRADDLNVTAGAAHSLAARPSTLTGSLSPVPQEGVEPSRPRGHMLLRHARLPVPPPGLGVAGEI